MKPGDIFKAHCRAIADTPADRVRYECPEIVLCAVHPPPTKANGHVYHHAAVQSPNHEINQGSEACIVTRNHNNTNIGEPHDPR